MTDAPGQYPKEFLDDLRARISVSSVVGKRVKLERRGREFVGLSPFSHEKTPSFTVSDEKGFYHCFSTGAHGDIFTFVMKTQNLEFRDAVEQLASEAGLPVPRPSPGQAKKAAQIAALQQIIEAACALFEDALWGDDGRNALAYLRGRGLSDSTIKRFRLGYAPAGNYLKERLIARGVTEFMLLEARLIAPGKEGRDSFDFFRDRVMFPIADNRNRVVAFGGRVLGDGIPKYLNSGESPLFHKGQMVYGLTLARDMALSRKELIVVEGYMDVIAMAQAGFENTVAPLGTALTEHQLAVLWRHADEPLICLDGDKAGRDAAARAANRALPVLKPGASLRFVTLPEGKDPDDLCRAGVDVMAGVLKESVPLSEQIWRQLMAAHPTNTPERRAGFEAAAIKLVDGIADETVRGQYRQYIAGRIASELAPTLALPETKQPVRETEHGPDETPPPEHKTPDDILGPKCPISALGYSKRGDARKKSVYYHFLDKNGQVVSLSASALRTPTIIGSLFFGGEKWLEEMADNRNSDGSPPPGDKLTWKASRIWPMLMRACDAAGWFEPDESTRGPGVWPWGSIKERQRKDDRVVVHTGDTVWQVGFKGGRATFTREKGGVRLGEYLYERTRRDDPLHDTALTDPEAKRLIAFYTSWNFKEREEVLGLPLVGFLLFGWLASANVLALLRRRPNVFLRGPTKVGKSEICNLNEALLGSAAIRLENATMTGLREKFIDPYPVRACICNEVNVRQGGAPQHDEKLREVLDLALYTYSAGEGGQARGPGGVSGDINSIFMFAAERPPVLNSSDANRMLVLNMDELPHLDADGLAAFRVWYDEVRGYGPALRRRMLERWGDYAAVYACFETQLVGLGYDQRGVDTFGTLLACGWIGSHAGLPTIQQAHALSQAVSTSLFAASEDDAPPEWKKCWQQLLTTKVDWFKDHSHRATVGELLEYVYRKDSASMDAARSALKANGIALVHRTSEVEKKQASLEGKPPPGPRIWVAIAYQHEGLDAIFRQTDWKGGKWNGVLGMFPGAERKHAATFAGQKRGKATLIPADEFKPQEDDDDYADDPETVRRAKENEIRA